MNKKYELIADDTINVSGRTLYRIRALVDIGDIVKAGDTGGYIENERNLSHDGNAWVYGNAKIYENAQVYGDASVCARSRIVGYAQVCGDAQVGGDAFVYGNAMVCGNAIVCGKALVCGDALVSGNVFVDGCAHVRGDALVDHQYKIMTISNMGNVQATTTFFVCNDRKIRVVCSCFFGDLDEFRAKVKETQRNTKHAQAYLAAADFVESVLVRGAQEDEQ